MSFIPLLHESWIGFNMKLSTILDVIGHFYSYQMASYMPNLSLQYMYEKWGKNPSHYIKLRIDRMFAKLKF